MTKNLFKKCTEFDWNFQSGSGMLKKIPPSLWGRIFSGTTELIIGLKKFLSSSLIVLSVFAPENRFLFQAFNPSHDT